MESPNDFFELKTPSFFKMSTASKSKPKSSVIYHELTPSNPDTLMKKTMLCDESASLMIRHLGIPGIDKLLSDSTNEFFLPNNSAFTLINNNNSNFNNNNTNLAPLLTSERSFIEHSTEMINPNLILDKLDNYNNKPNLTNSTNKSIDLSTSSSGATSTTSKSNKYQDYDEKIDKKRDKNRDAARKCRLKKLERIANLELQCKTLVEANKQKKRELELLQEEIDLLKYNLDQNNCNNL